MAINFTVSYTFSPNTTISSSQVNTNFTDEANVWTGLEAGTKSFAMLKVDGNPSTALEVAPKQYVDRYATWRRPVLQFASVTTVTIESGLDGTSGNIPILFPDGSVRTETSTTRTTFDITRNCVLTTSGAQSGLRSTLSEATNTWYALYAVKITDSSTQWVTVGDTRLPLQANYANLNTAFGTSGWVYLGLIRNGDNLSATGDILKFAQHGNITLFRNSASASNNVTGTLLATATATTVTWTYSAGTGTTSVPDNVLIGNIILALSGFVGADQRLFLTGTGLFGIFTGVSAQSGAPLFSMVPLSDNLLGSNGSVASTTWYIVLSGFVDKALGVGSNPLL